ncbi:hypothetical protein CHLNCDRAFT_144476 [Chlorella variabilis]|uniref:RING-type domain-containing protein n=1 Tax=Chlorella variabilis TaxID=554065 RepID=E1ZBI3_CHLVA|nr:hypothetical protein CHLNCDRAFT_144476 [Chlorella variabilis]EFN56652.1 hypothetical protein CHLNCDRAFT_144476 [Chlorella variabilis]|eukprot:XP_005848754.1 hypothetical protein CHLNCDRAFT_144476 [Chlorella variabilis]
MFMNRDRSAAAAAAPGPGPAVAPAAVARAAVASGAAATSSQTCKRAAAAAPDAQPVAKAARKQPQAEQAPPQHEEAQQQQPQPPQSNRDAATKSLIAAARLGGGRHKCLAALHAALAELGEAGAAGSSSQADPQSALDEALIAATQNSDPGACLAAVKELLDAGAVPNQLAPQGSSGSSALPDGPALHAFLTKPSRTAGWTADQHTAVLAALLAAGACAVSSDPRLKVPLHLAAMLPNAAAAEAAVAALVAAGADVDAAQPATGLTPLHHAAFNTSADAARAAVSALLKAGADPLVADASGRLPATYAASCALTPRVGAPVVEVLTNAVAARWQQARQQLTQLKEQHEALQACTVCMAAPRTTALLPCGHFAPCAGCATACKQCPVCRAKPRCRQTIHLS